MESLNYDIQMSIQEGEKEKTRPYEKHRLEGGSRQLTRLELIRLKKKNKQQYENK